MADLVLFNANVMTMDSTRPRARQVVIKDGIIRDVSHETHRQFHSSKHVRRVDCKGKTVLPGFIDAHFHLHAFAERFSSLDLSDRDRIRSIADIRSLIRRHAAGLEPGTWIRAKGYNEFYLAEGRHPNRQDLDRATRVHPVKLTHRSGHAHVLNSPALKQVGLTRATDDPTGGVMDRRLADGEPTGLLYEMGGYLSGRIPPISPDQMQTAVRSADLALMRMGITSIQDATVYNGSEQWRAFGEYREKGHLNTRVRMMIGAEALGDFIPGGGPPPILTEQLGLGGVKIILDASTGKLLPEPSELNETVRRIHRLGLQVAIHAIEPPAVEAACAAIAAALAEKPRPDHRHRIEHCSVCPPRLAERIAALGIVVVTQPAFVYAHGERYLQTVDAGHLRHLYPINTLLEKGVVTAGGSDAPIVDPNPFIGIYAAATRSCETGEKVLAPEKISVAQALGLFTTRAAFSAFEETVKGSITPGKVGDVILVDGDPTRVPLRELKHLSVEMTVCGGRVVYPIA